MNRVRGVKSSNKPPKQTGKEKGKPPTRAIQGPRHRQSIGYCLENPSQIRQMDSGSVPIVEGQMGYRNRTGLGGPFELHKLIFKF